MLWLLLSLLLLHAQLQVDPMPMAYSPSIDTYTQNNIVTIREQIDNQLVSACQIT
jgi:hypothetical protein